MKLIYCKKCRDVRKLDYAVTVCKCGASKGWRERDGLRVTLQGEAVPLGFHEPAFTSAIRDYPEAVLAGNFPAYVVSKDCPDVTKLDN